MAATGLAAFVDCTAAKRPHTCQPVNPAQTRNRILEAAPADSLVVFVGRARIWVMGSAVARLTRGVLDPRELAEGVHEPLLKALYQETRHKGGRVSRIIVYAPESVPENTVRAVTDTARSSKLGRVLVLPWSLVRAGSCPATAGLAPKTEPAEKRLEPKLGAEYPLVIRADARAVWINGRLALRLDNGRFVQSKEPGSPVESVQRTLLARRLRTLLAKIPVQRWRLLVVVTHRVSDSVVRMILSAAGQAGVTKFNLERELDH